jgi:hypothetical protein
MIRYRYTDQLHPPAPFVKVTLRCRTTGSRVADLPAYRIVLDGPQLVMEIDRPR